MTTEAMVEAAEFERYRGALVSMLLKWHTLRARIKRADEAFGDWCAKKYDSPEEEAELLSMIAMLLGECVFLSEQVK